VGGEIASGKGEKHGEKPKSASNQTKKMVLKRVPEDSKKGCTGYRRRIGLEEGRLDREGALLGDEADERGG